MLQNYENILRMSEQYFPNADVITQVRNTTVAALIGPTGVGKSACIDYITANYAFMGVDRFTTRPIRSVDTPDSYRFIPHEDAGLNYLYELIQRGEILQYAVHPDSGYVYGSQLHPDQKDRTIIDVVFSGMADLYKLPFKSLYQVSLFTDYQSWLDRINQRAVSAQDRENRRQEAVKSLKWSLEQGYDTFWVLNSVGKISETSQIIVDITEGKREPDQLNRVAAGYLLKQLETS